MKNLLLVTTITISLFCMNTISVNAESNWLKKGTDLLNTVNQGTSSSGSTSTGTGDLSLVQISDAFKQALEIGSVKVVDQLGSVDGFNSDPAVHIPLPNNLEKVKSVLNKVGMSSMVDDLELKLNRAAEAATPKAKALFLDSIKAMTFEDVKNIYEGPKDSATQYFKEKMSPQLVQEMKPIIDNSLSTVGAINAYDQVMGKYSSIPFVPDVKADLTDHVVTKGMDGIFHYIAQEEAAIRSNPVKQTTELLKKVFGTQ